MIELTIEYLKQCCTCKHWRDCSVMSREPHMICDNNDSDFYKKTTHHRFNTCDRWEVDEI